ncbi:hypothetical protein D3C86_1619610 [compost metagenome]
MVFQAGLRQLAGQVEAAAGFGRGDAFGALGLGGEQLAGEGETGGGEGEAGEGGVHGSFSDRFLLWGRAYQIGRL